MDNRLERAAVDSLEALDEAIARVRAAQRA